MAQSKKCKHPACNCVTSDGKDYCGDHCKNSKKMTELTCQCNHADCKGKPHGITRSKSGEAVRSWAASPENFAKNEIPPTWM